MVNFFKIEPGVCRYIDSSDECYYLMEYHARKGYQYSNENGLIYNFKKPLDDKGQQYKVQAIGKVAEILCALFKSYSNYVFIPIPTSKSKTDSLHDSRLIQVLKIVEKEINLPYYDLLDRQVSAPPLHSGTVNRTPSNHKLSFNCEDTSVLQNKTIILFDDVVTTGSTYKAAKEMIMEKTSNIRIVGLFISRSIAADTQCDI